MHAELNRVPREDYIDDFTGLLNRKYFDFKLDHEIEHNPGKVALLFIDLDELKLTNTLYGTLAGDALLQDTASVLQDTALVVQDSVRHGSSPPAADSEKRYQASRKSDV